LSSKIKLEEGTKYRGAVDEDYEQEESCQQVFRQKGYVQRQKIRHMTNQ
jgi:hypothetical protein